jgi:hypothetical protein
MLRLVGGRCTVDVIDGVLRVRSADRPRLTPDLSRALYVAFEQLKQDQREAEQKAA